MAHEFKQGFSVREPMWHGLGTVLDHYPGREEAMRLAGHDFTVTERRVGVEQQLIDSPFGNDVLFQQVPGWKALVREDNGKLLNVVKNSYEIVQNEVIWDIVDALVAEPNVKYETAGTLREGAVLWVLAYLDEPVRIPGDNSDILPFFAAKTTHDGSGACSVEATDVRIVCMNTFSWSESKSKKRGTTFTFKHTKNVGDKIAAAKEAITGVRKAHNEFVELATELANVTLNEEQIKYFLANMFPMPQESEGQLITERVRGNVLAARGKVNSLLYSETTPEAHRNTGYGLWQAGIEYLDHVRGTKGDEKVSKFNRSIMRQEPVKTKLAELVREAAAA